MKLRLIDIIVCPSCKNAFNLKVNQSEKREYSPAWFERVTGFWRKHSLGGAEVDSQTLWDSYCTEIINGELICEKCHATYPIEGGIPKLLPPELRTIAGELGRGDPASDVRINKFMDEIEPVKQEQDHKVFTEIQLANQSNYGYEWQVFAHDSEKWDELYKKEYVLEPDEFFEGKLGLDAGCGNARFTLPAVKRGAEMIGVDLSNAIQAAYARSQDIPTFHAIQGDIFNLPFREGYFDFAQSLGVIHITPDPEEALLSIKRLVKPGGNVFLMVYKTFEEDNLFKHYLLKPVNLLRKFTSRLPSNVLYYFLYLLLPIVLITCYFPSWLLWHLPGGRKLSNMFPYNYGHHLYREGRTRNIHMNLFDRFGSPVERRYTRQEMINWLDRTGFEDYLLANRYAWYVTATTAGQLETV